MFASVVPVWFFMVMVAFFMLVWNGLFFMFPCMCMVSCASVIPVSIVAPIKPYFTVFSIDSSVIVC